MKVTVRYSGQARAAAGAGSEEANVDVGAKLPDLLIALAGRHGEALGKILLAADGSVQPSLLLFVNDEQVFRGESPALKDGDEVMVMAPISGG